MSGNEPSERRPAPLRFHQRAAFWDLPSRRLTFSQLPALMGILNITPDSFSDGGSYLSASAAVERAWQLAADGADILDIGGESTRPFSEPITAEEELQRVLPVLEALRGRLSIPISIDTSKAIVAREALAAGAEIINDVTALAGDSGMIAVAADGGAAVCAMHMQGTPATMQNEPTYFDVVREVSEFLKSRRDALIAGGIARERIALDPGIGFGKTHQHNLTLLAGCSELHVLGQPVLVGPSRKGFIAKVLQDRQAERQFGTIGVALALAQSGIQILRVHDVRPVREALAVFAAAGGIDGRALQLPP